MTFADTLREERLINRRSRGRKARIAGRIIGFALTACLVVALRTDPQLRSLVEETAMWVIGAAGSSDQTAAGASQSAQTAAIEGLGYTAGSQEAAALDQLGITGTAQGTSPGISQLPPSKVTIHRGGISRD